MSDLEYARGVFRRNDGGNITQNVKGVEVIVERIPRPAISVSEPPELEARRVRKPRLPRILILALPLAAVVLSLIRLSLNQ